MNKNEAEKIIKETVEYANKEIVKVRKKCTKNILIILGIILLLIVTYLLIFKYEIPVKYNEEMIKTELSEDQALVMTINLSNYKNAKAILVKIDDNTYDLYINITQTLATKIWKDDDKSNNLLRIGNNMIIDFQTEKVREYMPNSNTIENLNRIYYVDTLNDKIATMDDQELMNYQNKVLIWER